MASSTFTYPYDTVVRITDTIGDHSWQGSGVLISPDEVLTASHVVYIAGQGTANDIVVTPGFDGASSPYGSADGDYIHYMQISEVNGIITNAQSQSDFAVIHLATPFSYAGYMGIQPDFAGGPANITGYPASAGGEQISSQQTVYRDPIYTLLDGPSEGQGSSGGPVWIDTGSGPMVVGIVSSLSLTSGTGFNNMITAAELNQIEAWVQLDDAAPVATSSPMPVQAAPALVVFDTTKGNSVPATSQSYTGPVTDLQAQFISTTPDSLNITAATSGWFLHSGSGSDALTASSGTNVLDGGMGSNFLTGGRGTDTFFVDDRVASSDVWSTVNGFHAGDAATIWGVTPADFSLATLDNQGAPGYTGLTFGFAAPGKPNASLTLVGYGTADLSNGRLAIAYGATSNQPGAPGSAFMYIRAM